VTFVPFWRKGCSIFLCVLCASSERSERARDTLIIFGKQKPEAGNFPASGFLLLHDSYSLYIFWISIPLTSALLTTLVKLRLMAPFVTLTGTTTS
jgi:hypothetical protein